MALDPWLPIGFKLPDGAAARIALFEGAQWQILETSGGGRALVVHDELAQRWRDAGLLEPGTLIPFAFGEQRLLSLSCGASQVLCPVSEGRSPDTKAEALAFALALKATRALDAESPLQDALYVEKRPFRSFSSRAALVTDSALSPMLSRGWDRPPRDVTPLGSVCCQ